MVEKLSSGNVRYQGREFYPTTRWRAWLRKRKGQVSQITVHQWIGYRSVDGGTYWFTLAIEGDCLLACRDGGYESCEAALRALDDRERKKLRRAIVRARNQQQVCADLNDYIVKTLYPQEYERDETEEAMLRADEWR